MVLSFRSIALLCMLAVGAIARGANAPVDSWGQTPRPDLAAKVNHAVEASKSAPADAERMLREVVAADPNYYSAQFNLGLLVLQKQDRAKEAVKELEKALDIKQRLKIKDSTIYGELALASYRADDAPAATKRFREGVEHLKELKPADQKKLLERGVAFFLDYQDPADARKLLDQATNGDQEVLKEVREFLRLGIERLTKNDPPEGWVRYAKQPIGAGPDATYIDQLFVKADGSPGPPKKGDIVTPKDTTVNMRADKLHSENSDSTLASWIGRSSVGGAIRGAGAIVSRAGIRSSFTLDAC